MTVLNLSVLVFIAFLAAAGLFLTLAKASARRPPLEAWLVALSAVGTSSALLWILSELGWLLNRTPALIHAGFAAVVLVWTVLRHGTAHPGSASAPSTAGRWTVAIPLSGMLLSLPAIWDGIVIAPPVVDLVQTSVIGAAWLMFGRRAEARRAPSAGAAPPPARRPTPGLRADAVAESPGAPRVFICYRRDDSADVTGRIYDRLAEHFGREQVFKDVDSIPLGVDFRTHLAAVVGACDIVIAVIGNRWLAAGSEGQRRLGDDDFVRIELEAALQRQIPVVPVLVGGARLPSAGDVPASLAALVYRQGLAVRPDPDFHRDVDRLIHGLEHGRRTVSSPRAPA